MSLNKPLYCETISTITYRLSFFHWCAGLHLERGHGATHKTVNFVNGLNLCFAKKIINYSNFVPNRLLKLHPTQAVTLSREDFKAKAEQIDNIYKVDFFLSKPSSGIICESFQTNLKM